MRPLLWMYEKLLLIGMILAALLIAAMATLVSTDVLLRNLRMPNLPWVTEVSEYILFLATFLAAPWVLRQGAHVRVDILVRGIPEKSRRVVQVFANLVGLAVCLFLVRYGFKAFAEAFELKSMIFKQLAIPEWWFYTLIPASGMLLAVEFILRICRIWKNQEEEFAPFQGGN